MQDMPSHAFGRLIVFIPILLFLLGAVIVYLVLMVRCVLDMLRHEAHGVLLTFAFLALIPVPPTLVLGVMILIIWHFHKKDLVAGEKQTENRAVV